MIVLFCGECDQGVEASDDGVLGGFAQVNEPDIIASEGFLNTLLKEFFPNSGKNQHLVALGQFSYNFFFFLFEVMYQV